MPDYIAELEDLSDRLGVDYEELEGGIKSAKARALVKYLHRRIFPIVLEDADIYQAINRLRCIKYWENRIAGLTDTIKDMNTLTPEMHRGTQFEALYRAIEAAMEQDRR